MNILLKFGDERVAGFDELLDRYPLNQFNSPRRSTVPLLVYWRETARCQDFFKQLAIQLPGATDSLTLSFEHEVPVQAGKGYPSCTDLMILGDRLVVAVEAKYTEPDYETVRQWLRRSDTENRRVVLQGWLGLINRTTGSRIDYSDVLDIAYQCVHRAASACFPHQGAPDIARFMVYQFFSDAEGVTPKIAQDLAVLEKLVPSTALRVAIVTVRLEKKPAFTSLEERWTRGKERFLREEVVAGLKADTLFGFC